MEKELLEQLMQNPAFVEALKGMLLENKDLANELGCNQELVFVLCAEMHNDNEENGVYYHPIVVPARAGLSVDELFELDSYKMVSSTDQFEVHDNSSVARMFRMAYPHIPVHVVAVPRSTYEKLEEDLMNLMRLVIDGINVALIPLETVARLTHTDSNRLKMQLISSILGNMTTVSSCINRSMKVCNSDIHNYDSQLSDDEDDDYEGCYDEDDELWLDAYEECESDDEYDDDDEE